MEKIKKIICILSILFVLLIITLILKLNNIKHQNDFKGSNTAENTETETIQLISDEEQINIYFNEFINLVNNNDLYNKLNTSYLQAKFSNLSDYNSYFVKNKNIWKTAKLNTYEVFNGENYKDFICTDTNNNYYIFRQENENYTIILDIYSINLEWLENKYNNSDDVDKLKLILNKIENIIKCEDYEKLYSLLSNNFKNESFENFEDFKNYIMTKFPQDATYSFFNEIINDNTYSFILILNNDEDYYLSMPTIVKANDINNFIFAIKTNYKKSSLF